MKELSLQLAAESRAMNMPASGADDSEASQGEAKVKPVREALLKDEFAMEVAKTP